MTQHNLQSYRVLVTRPSAQADHWQQLLKDHGATPVLAPLMAIRPFDEHSDPQAVRSIKNIILDFDGYTHVIFVSQNAVKHGMDWLDEYWPQLPERQTYFAVGKATAAALSTYDVEVVAADTTMNTEALLALPELHHEKINGAAVLIFRGQGGRPLLAEELKARGAQVTYGELYEREFPGGPKHIRSIIDQESFGQGKIDHDVVAIHSGESLQNWNRVVTECDPEQTASLRALPLLTPGARVAELAREMGYNNTIVALNASDDEMLKALVQWQSAQGVSDPEEHQIDRSTPLSNIKHNKANTMTSSDPTTQPPAKPQTETADVAEATVEKTVKKEKTTAAPKKKAKTKKRGPFLLVAVNVILLLCVAALSVAGYLGWQHIQQANVAISDSAQARFKQQAVSTQQLQQQLSSQAHTLATLHAQQNSGGQKWQLQLEQHERRLGQQQQQLNTLTSTNRSDWQLAEAEYLLRLANQNLLMQQGTQGALDLLLAADDILLNVGDMNLFNIRKSLAQDITALQLLPQLDRAGIYLQLAALSDQILTLPETIEIILIQQGQQSETMPTEFVADTATWQQKLRAYFDLAMTKLDKYVQIRPNDKPIKPLMSPQNSTVVRQNISLLIEQSQLALLKSEATIFKQSLSRAAAQIEQYFPGQKNAAMIGEQLHKLSATNIVIAVPNISGSLKELRDHISLLHRLSDQAGASAAVTVPVDDNKE